jgi:hypothetical protein
VKLKRGEVAYCVVEGAGLVEPRRAGALAVTDTGVFVVTNQLCLFVGAKRSTEWTFAKLLGCSLERDTVAVFNVSNRQKTTGVQYAAEDEPRTAAATARFRGEEEHAALVNELEEDHRRAFAAWEEAGSHMPPTA